MNSEIEYENFIKNIDLVIYDKIDIDTVSYTHLTLPTIA